jgi:hypothetical protein
MAKKPWEKPEVRRDAPVPLSERVWGNPRTGERIKWNGREWVSVA